MYFVSGVTDVLEAHYIVWDTAFVMFYEEVTESNHVLVAALNNTSVREITELTEPDNSPKLVK